MPLQRSLAPSTLLRLGVAPALLLALACGGGGGSASSSPYSVSVNPDHLAFQAERGASVPGGQTLSATFKGDGLLVGYPSGTPVPTWLGVSNDPPAGNTVAVHTSITTTDLAPGTYTSTLRFVTGKSDGSAYVTKDVPVRYRVFAGLSPSPAAVAFTTLEGTAPGTQNLAITTDTSSAGWTLTMQAAGDGPTDWLSLSAESGTAPATVQLHAAQRPRGTYRANLILKNQVGATKATIPLTYTVGGVFDLAGTLGATLTTASTPANLQVPLTLQTHLSAAAGAAETWQITSDQPWLTVSPASGNLSASTPLTATLHPDLMGTFPNGPTSATLTVQLTASAYSDLSTAFVVNLDLPQVTHVAPYTTWVGRTSPLILRGSGFLPATTLPVHIGSATATGTVISDTEIHVTAPTFVLPGSQAVGLDNALGILRNQAELRILPAPGYTATTLTLPAAAAEAVLDPERQAILLRDGAGIQRIRFADGTWSQEHHDLAYPTGHALGMDGKDLYVTSSGIYQNDVIYRLDPDTFALKDSQTNTDYYTNFRLVAGFNDGRVLILNSEQWMQGVLYPNVNTHVNVPSVHGAEMLQTRDRSRLILHSWSSAPTSTLAWDVNGPDNVFPFAYSDPVSTQAWSISQDGGRYVNGLNVFDHGFQKLGTISLPEPGLVACAVSQDGSAVYTLSYTPGPGDPAFALRKTDVTAPTGPYTAGDPLGITFATGESPYVLLVSEDGSTLFILSVIGGSGPNPIYQLRVFPLS